MSLRAHQPAEGAKPKYALVHLNDDIDLEDFYALLADLGLNRMTFVHSLRDIPQSLLDEDKKNPSGSVVVMVPDIREVPGSPYPPRPRRETTAPNTSNSEESTRPESPVDIKPDVAQLNGTANGTTSALFRASSSNATPIAPVPPGRIISNKPLRSFVIEESDRSKKYIAMNGDQMQRDHPYNIVDVQPVNDVPKEAFSREMYASCQLCDNKIMSSRISNLTNHVRRHASMKQFECIYCSYSHNEMAKVRLHMQHNHKDSQSQPKDNISPSMVRQWEILMEKCFPGFSTKEDVRVFSNSRTPLLDVAIAKTRIRQPFLPLPRVSPDTEDATSAANKLVQDKRSSSKEVAKAKEDSRPSYSPQVAVAIEKTKKHLATNPVVQKDFPKAVLDLAARRKMLAGDSNSGEGSQSNTVVDSYECNACNEPIKRALMENHLAKKHRLICISYRCEPCQYTCTPEEKMRSHLREMHNDHGKPLGLAPGASPQLFIRQFFPTFRGPTSEEEWMVGKEPSEAGPSQKMVDVKMEDVPLIEKNQYKEEESEFPDDLEEEPEAEPIGMIDCELCHRPVDSSDVIGLNLLLSHAKRHYKQKQWHCTQCDHSGTEPEQVENHLIVKHRIMNERPIDMSNKVMRGAWIGVMKRCFPSHIDSINALRFKKREIDERAESIRATSQAAKSTPSSNEEPSPPRRMSTRTSIPSKKARYDE